MKNIKKYLYKFIVKPIIVFLCIIGVISICMFIFFATDNVGNCLDMGMVWDGDRKECRSDCLTWNEKDGCVPITADNIIKKEKEQ